VEEHAGEDALGSQPEEAERGAEEEQRRESLHEAVRGREGDRADDDRDDRPEAAEQGDPEPSVGELLGQRRHERDHHGVRRIRKGLARLPVRGLQALLTGRVEHGLERVLGDQDPGEEDGREAERPGPGARLPYAELTPRDAAGDPERDAEDQELLDEPADGEAVLEERVARRLAAACTPRVGDERERSGQGEPRGQLPIARRRAQWNASGWRILATAKSAFPTPGPGWARRLGTIPKRPERTAASFFVCLFARSWASVVPPLERTT